MNITITGVHMQTGEGLQTHARKALHDLLEKFDQIHGAEVAFHHDHHQHHADITVHASGLTLRAGGEGTDFYHATDAALHKIKRQVERYKGRMLKHRKRLKKHGTPVEHLAEGLHAADHHIDEKSLETFPEEMLKDYLPKIIRRDVKKIMAMSVDDAVMQMDLLHAPVYLFQNPHTGSLNVVYREPNGKVGWITPAEPTAKTPARTKQKATSARK